MYLIVPTVGSHGVSAAGLERGEVSERLYPVPAVRRSVMKGGVIEWDIPGVSRRAPPPAAAGS